MQNKYKTKSHLEQLSLIISIVCGFTLPCQAENENSFFNSVQYSFEPYLLIDQNYNDNLLLSENSKISTWGTSVSPSLKMNLENKGNFLSIFYGPQKIIYLDSPEDDVTNHTIQGDLNVQITRRSRVNFFASYLRDHEDRGTGFSQGIGDLLSEPDAFRRYNTGTTLVYGTEESLGRLELSLKAEARRLDNRTSASRYANQDNYIGQFTFHYQFRPNTTLLTEIYTARNLYQSFDEDNSLDNIVSRFLIGTTWNATSLSTGIIKIGVLRRDFTENNDSFMGFGWDATVKLTPLESTSLQFNTNFQTEETEGIGNFVETTSVSSTLTYRTNPLFQTSIDVNVLKNEYRPTSQKQGKWQASLKMSYQIRRWMTLSGSVSHQEQLSTIVEQDFNRNVYIIGFLFQT